MAGGVYNKPVSVAVSSETVFRRATITSAPAIQRSHLVFSKFGKKNCLLWLSPVSCISCYRFVCKNNGILFENDIIQIGVKSEFKTFAGKRQDLSFIKKSHGVIVQGGNKKRLHVLVESRQTHCSSKEPPQLSGQCFCIIF